MDMIGKILGGRYEIIEKIGEGGMAEVYKAKCHLLNRYVAVKILKPEYAKDETFVKRFRREAQSAAALTHANIVSVYDVGAEGDINYIVMELLESKTLKDYIEEHGAMPSDLVLKISAQIASALETAHKAHIIHRDIKPQNIVLNKNMVAKVTDFGIAKITNVPSATITSFGSTMGSVHYFSPEHARGGFTDEKSDIYSLGVVMYEMLTGRVPFDADTPVSVALKHMQEEPIAAIVANPNIPIAVNDIIMKSLKKDPNLRYQSATAMLIDLKRALKEPQGNFVDNNEYVDAPTQRISTIQDDNRGPKATAKKKENKFVAFVKKHKVLSTIVGLILLFVLSLGTTLGIANATRTKDVAIPNLVGKTVDEAKKLVQDSKLVYSEGEAEYSADVEAGKIISQNPKYTQNGTVKEKSEIKVIVSLGTEKTKVPKFVGTTKEEAEKSAKDAKLKLEFVEETSKTIESGYITKQETDEGTEVNAGDTVKVYISIGTGIKQVVVTSVLQKDVETAKKSLEEKGLVVEIEYTEDKTKDNGVVLNQSIKSGETVDEGSTITLTVNKIAETKTGTVTINVKSITGYQDKIKKPVTESVKGETTSTTIQKEVEVDNTPNTIQLKVTVDGETVTDEKVKENVTDKQVSVSGKGNVTIKVYIDGILKKTVDMNLNNTDKLTIE